MPRDLKKYLWLLKLGAIANLYFLVRTLSPPLSGHTAQMQIPALIVFSVSAFRCTFPVRYRDNIVFHDSVFSSIFLTRLLATFSEIALIYQLAYLIRMLNFSRVGWLNGLSWVMLGLVILSQLFVWAAILTSRPRLFFYEELGWFFIFAANTMASIGVVFAGKGFDDYAFLVYLNLIFGCVYLPWQIFHLRSLQVKTQHAELSSGKPSKSSSNLILNGLHRAIYVKNPSIEPQAWGGVIGIIWMTGYWAALIPLWVFLIVQSL